MASTKMMNHQLDLYKGVACILVIFIHISVPEPVNAFVMSLAKAAVPLFFVVSGYYAHDYSTARLPSRYFAKIFRSVKLLLVASTVYAIFNAVILFAKGGRQVKSLIFANDVTVDNIARFVFLCKPEQLFRISPHMWFLFALTYAYVAFYFIANRGWYRLAYMMSLVFVVGYIMTFEILVPANYVELEYGFRRNFFVTGFPFFTMGFAIRRNEEFVTGLAKKYSLLGVILTGWFVSLVETIYFKEADYGLGIIVFVTAIFCHSLLSRGRPSIIPLLSAIGSGLAFSIYAYHPIFISFVQGAGKRLNLYGNASYQYCAPVVVALLSVAFAYGIKHISTRRRE